MSDYLRLEIQLDGSGGGLFKGNLLVLGFKWRDDKKDFELIPINQEWDRRMTHDPTFQMYLDLILLYLHEYRKEALKLAFLKLKIEAFSGFSLKPGLLIKARQSRRALSDFQRRKS